MWYFLIFPVIFVLWRAYRFGGVWQIISSLAYIAVSGGISIGIFKTMMKQNLLKKKKKLIAYVVFAVLADQLIKVIIYQYQPDINLIGKALRIAVLKDTADKQLNIVGRNGAVVGRRVFVPEVLALFRKGVARLLRHAGFDAVADIALIRPHCTDRRETGCCRRPAVHKAQAVVSPFSAVVGIAVTGIGDKIYFVGFFCGKCGRSHAKQRGNAHQHRKKQRHRSFEFLRFH